MLFPLKLCHQTALAVRRMLHSWCHRMLGRWACLEQPSYLLLVTAWLNNAIEWFSIVAHRLCSIDCSCRWNNVSWAWEQRMAIDYGLWKFFLCVLVSNVESFACESIRWLGPLIWPQCLSNFSLCEQLCWAILSYSNTARLLCVLVYTGSVWWVMIDTYWLWFMRFFVVVLFI